jgi:hypothetical protein
LIPEFWQGLSDARPWGTRWGGGDEGRAKSSGHVLPLFQALERASYREVVLVQCLRRAIGSLNPAVPPAAREDAVKQVLDLGTPVLLAANHRFHRLLLGGVPVQYQLDGETRGDFVRLVDWGVAANNEWLAINQFSISGAHHTRRPDIVLVVNLRMRLLTDEKFAKARYLDPGDAKSAKKDFYNPNVLPVFDAHYTKR